MYSKLIYLADKYHNYLFHCLYNKICFTAIEPVHVLSLLNRKQVKVPLNFAYERRADQRTALLCIGPKCAVALYHVYSRCNHRKISTYFFAARQFCCTRFYQSTQIVIAYQKVLQTNFIFTYLDLLFQIGERSLDILNIVRILQVSNFISEIIERHCFELSRQNGSDT